MTTDSLSPVQELAREVDAGVAPVVFTPAPDFRHFDAEFRVTGDLAFHFYPGASDKPGNYWTTIFPAALERAAKDYFRADAPRLEAAHVEDFDLDSWWLLARGFGHVLEPDLLAYGFLARLDRECGEERELDEPPPALSP